MLTLIALATDARIPLAWWFKYRDGQHCLVLAEQSRARIAHPLAPTPRGKTA
ncbi:hypothetical protein [Azonexus sp.]|jgi:hypothetical protein|uniref:hypothetical protein n=1 Tax=Azonexus sp. TaxID=1872668 RepID=UPI0028288A5A|nr:hypothetical protein [Azonexus sp.]MDR1994168.1 hypothetical protein [Azonexus sp.]